jgi:hypothetical protein
MLEPLLGSTNAERVLMFIAIRSEGYSTEIAHFFDTDVYGIQKQIEKFETAGILIAKQAGRTRIYQFSPRYAFIKELRALLDKAFSFYPSDEQERLKIIRKRPRRKGKPQ